MIHFETSTFQHRVFNRQGFEIENDIAYRGTVDTTFYHFVWNATSKTLTWVVWINMTKQPDDCATFDNMVEIYQEWYLPTEFSGYEFNVFDWDTHDETFIWII